MNKQDEEKAIKIAQGTVCERTRNHPSNLPHIIIVRDACLEMAVWKEQQMIEKTLSYLNNKFYFNNLFYGVVSTDFNSMEEMFEDFKQEMKGE